MYMTLVYAVVLTAIAAFFSQEFTGFFKKIFAIPGVKLILPLALASWLVESYEDWLLWILLTLKNALHYVVHGLDALIPLHLGAVSFAHIIHLFLLASVPVWVILALGKSRGMYEPWPYTYLVGIVLWLLAAILLTIHQP